MGLAKPVITTIIPALNEEASIGLVVAGLQRVAAINHLQIKIVVADNGSTDATANIAVNAGCLVVSEPERGYGAACLKALAAADRDSQCILFIDADCSDRVEEFPELVMPILADQADLVLGSRTLAGKERERGALTAQQIFGNWLATTLIRLFFKQRYSDLGPFRAIAPAALQKLKMADRNFGWTVEMQIRAVKYNLRILEIPVSYRRRIGKSKISGTVKGTLMAGYIIIRTIMREVYRGNPHKPRNG